MEIRYASAQDGTRLAYASLGEGPPLLLVPTEPNNLVLDAEYEGARKFREMLSADRRLVMWDCRGLAQSQRDVEDLSLDARVGDIAAIAGELGIDQFDLAACAGGTPSAIAFAAKNPERVRRLVLWGAHVSRPADLSVTQGSKALIDAVRKHWPLARAAMASTVFPKGPVEAHQWLMDTLGKTLSPETQARLLEIDVETDVSAEAAAVACPTLLITYKGDVTNPPGAARHAAALIPDSRLVIAEGDAGHYYWECERWMDTVLRFLDEDRDRRERPPAPPDRLSAREIEVLRLLAHGKTNQEIAETLVISMNTVAHHVTNILNKAGVSNRTEAAGYAHKYGIV